MNCVEYKLFFSYFSDCSSDDSWGSIDYLDEHQPSPKVIDKFVLAQELYTISQEFLKGKLPHNGLLTRLSNDDSYLYDEYSDTKRSFEYDEITANLLHWETTNENIVVSQCFSSLDNTSTCKGDTALYFLLRLTFCYSMKVTYH